MLTATALALGGCGEEAPETPPAPAGGWIDPAGEEPIVGSLAVDPGDGTLWMSTNTGLYRVPGADGPPARVTGRLTTPDGSGDLSEQLVVHFTGPGELLASGHPAPDQADLPAALGLLRSDDGARTWTSVSELGRADFHTLDTVGDAVIGALYGLPQVLVSDDGGRSWETRAAPRPLIDLAVHPEDAKWWIGTTSDGIYLSRDGGATWRAVDPEPNARLAWAAPGALYRIDPGGPVQRSADAGRSWTQLGSTGGEPRALAAAGTDQLYAALLDGTVLRSADAGRSWTKVLTPE